MWIFSKGCLAYSQPSQTGAKRRKYTPPVVTFDKKQRKEIISGDGEKMRSTPKESPATDVATSKFTGT